MRKKNILLCKTSLFVKVGNDSKWTLQSGYVVVRIYGKNVWFHYEKWILMSVVCRDKLSSNDFLIK